ncbi:hypothetical protein C8R44DRAFT_891902 [Mycena epipterygia]|nr:hypothetical protein C8R44DRAFT_891902 [Mycena epipterygia]
MPRTLRLEQALTPLARIYCVPEYFPHTAHTHSIRDHGENPDCLFFAVFTGDFDGIYTAFSQIQKILRDDPDAECGSHKDWIGITTKWRGHCSNNHEHQWPRSASGSSSPLSSASAFDTSPSPSRTPSPEPPSIPFYDPPAASRSTPRTPSPRKKPLQSPLPSPSPTKTSKPAMPRTFASPTKGPASDSTLTARAVAPAPQALRPLSPQSPGAPAARPPRQSDDIARQFPRPGFGGPLSLLPFPARLLPEMGAFPPDSRRPRPPSMQRGLASLPPQYEDVPEEPERHSRSIYAPRSLYSIPCDGGRADSRGRFRWGSHWVLDAAAMGSIGSRIYAVSGHRVAFKDSKDAWRVFLQKEGAKMLFSTSDVEVDAFIRKHAPI